MNREELIEEAAKAIYANEREVIDGARDWPEWGDCPPSSRASVLDAARAALAVFEQAHTPTDDDEREALATILGEPVRGTLALADRILAAGFRRTLTTTKL